ncbi:MAG: ABC transporter ATP-binding protein/permease [Blastomonas fulva]|uniref:ABC transporter ATP-binding protein n=1 Tax=Blastomonas fulva TaxID=1550728 RepID=UPI0024E1D2D9|nr:ABC transporter ATP-binding protein [Blastomonas fulva]MDK2757734.1 ABC transporter ATP-binding protein/permease [Blastomonas fulva]
MIFVASSVLEVAGVLSIVPFLAVLGSPAAIGNEPLINAIYVAGNFKSHDELLIALGSAAFAMLVIAALVRLMAVYLLNRYIHGCRSDLSCRLFEGYLRQPYEFFFARHSGDMSTIVLSEVDMFVDSALMPMAQIISSSFVFGILFALFVLIDPTVAMLATLSVCLIYLLIYRSSRAHMARSGHERTQANRERFEVASEAFAGIKSIKVMGLESSYLNRFRRPSDIAARSIILNATLSQVPRIIIEATGFGFIILLALMLTVRQQNQNDVVLPLLGLYAFAGYRMLPALQIIYQNLHHVRFAGSVITKLRDDIALCRLPPRISTPGSAPFLAQELRLDQLCFTYPTGRGKESQRAGISNISLTLQAGRSLGIIGKTGAGKTTLVDVILGLLLHDSGQITADGIVIDDSNRRAWQSHIGYVPQDIYLRAGSVAENIAFGLDLQAIDHARVIEVAKMVHIHEFIEKQLAEGYATHVGERGITLSGGQRQRIGIARALYRDPDLLIFDEATSALDTDTEAAVMNVLNQLSGKKTIIMIAHRLTTISRCDAVVRMDSGRIVENERSSAFVG